MVSIPLSYGSSLTGFGRFGARNRERMSGTTGKTTATARNNAMGPNVPSTWASVYPTHPERRLRSGDPSTIAPSLPSVADKPRFVADMFGRIAWRYDLMNTLMTGGQDQHWRRLVAETALAPPGFAANGRPVQATRPLVLDVGTGTGKLLQAIESASPDAY